MGIGKERFFQPESEVDQKLSNAALTKIIVLLSLHVVQIITLCVKLFYETFHCEKVKQPVPIFTKVRRRNLRRKRRRSIKLRSKRYSQKFVDLA